jgi:quinol monooxygenase YgiN
MVDAKEDKRMIQAMLKMDFKPGKAAEAVGILCSMLERIRATTGCIDCSVYRQAGNECQVVFEEKWKSNEDLQRHLRSEEYRKVLMVMEMAVTRPEVQFETVSGLGGVELIEEARSKNLGIRGEKL